MLIQIIININEKTVTDGMDHSVGTEARWMRRCVEHSSGPFHLALSPWEGGGAGEGPSPDSCGLGWKADGSVFSSCCCPKKPSFLQGCSCSQECLFPGKFALYEVCEGEKLGLTHLSFFASSLPRSCGGRNIGIWCSTGLGHSNRMSVCLKCLCRWSW